MDAVLALDRLGAMPVYECAKYNIQNAQPGNKHQGHSKDVDTTFGPAVVGDVDATFYFYRCLSLEVFRVSFRDLSDCQSTGHKTIRCNLSI